MVIETTKKIYWQLGHTTLLPRYDTYVLGLRDHYSLRGHGQANVTQAMYVSMLNLHTTICRGEWTGDTRLLRSPEVIFEK